MFVTTARRKRIAIILLILTGALAAVGVALYSWLLADLPPLSAVETRLVRPTTQILDRNGRLLYEIVDPYAGKQIDLSLADTPKACIQATLATEDSRFYYHPGVDPLAIARATWQNYRAGGQVVSGGSTLTQQLARNLLLEPGERYEQSLRRKLREAWLALQLERRYSKDELLALYLNQTYYGHFAFGLEAAAQIFFAKPAAQLSRGECTLLAGLVQYPSGYNPLQSPEIAKARQLTVLRLMTESRFIDAEASQAIAEEPLRYRSRLFNIEAPHFVMYVQDLLMQRIGIDGLRTGGYRIYTTLDLDLQRQAERQIRYRLDQLNCRRPGLCDARTNPDRRVENAAAVILDARTGDILAMVGSPDYFDTAIQGNVNAALSLRQPGSAIKPLTYAAALDPTWAARGGYAPLTPASILADLPTTFYVRDEHGANVPYAPVNYDRLYHGPVSVRSALANSYNIPAVKTLDYIGVSTLKEIAADAGISTFGGDFGLALTLGGGEVRLLDLTTAFGIFQSGRRLEHRALLDVQQLNLDAASLPAASAPPAWRTIPAFRQLNLSPDRESRAVISPEAAYLITDILADPLARAAAFGETSILDLPFPAAVKTGTTTDWRDNWTVGYSSERIVGVWTGNADNAPMLDVSGIDGAGPIWRDLMLAAHLTPPASFARPPGITGVEICAPSGLLPSPYCPRQLRELFIDGTEPTRADDQFRPLVLDLATNLPADDATPAARQTQRVYWHLPPEYHDWMLQHNIPLPPTTIDDGGGRIMDEVAAQRSSSVISQASSLRLAAPASNIAFQIHPGAPRERQRIAIEGFTADGAPWHELRVMHALSPTEEDGLAPAQHTAGLRLHSQYNATRINLWWQLEPGIHHFWLEGESRPGAATERSQPALVLVESFSPTQLSQFTSGDMQSTLSMHEFDVVPNAMDSDPNYLIFTARDETEFVHVEAP